MRISELAKAAGVNVETIRYYQRTGLLSTPPRGSGFREYKAADLQRLRFIRRAQALGFTLEEIGMLLRLSVSDCKNVERIARERRAAVAQKIADLQRIQTVLADVIHSCKTRQPFQGCPIIEALVRA